MHKCSVLGEPAHSGGFLTEIQCPDFSHAPTYSGVSDRFSTNNCVAVRQETRPKTPVILANSVTNQDVFEKLAEPCFTEVLAHVESAPTDTHLGPPPLSFRTGVGAALTSSMESIASTGTAWMVATSR